MSNSWIYNYYNNNYLRKKINSFQKIYQLIQNFINFY